MADKIKELLEKNGQMIIDGSMSTALEQMGSWAQWQGVYTKKMAP